MRATGASVHTAEDGCAAAATTTTVPSPKSENTSQKGEKKTKKIRKNIFRGEIAEKQTVKWSQSHKKWTLCVEGGRPAI